MSEPSQSILDKALNRALGGGTAGAAAMGIQVMSLIWMRTTINYQYRYGLSTTDAFKTLYKEGGVRRFYRGVTPALVMGPMSRFGDTAANVGMLTLLEDKNLPIPVKTALASTAAGCWRIFLMPVDALKTTLQVEGANGMSVLRNRIKLGGVRSLYHGSLAAMSATMAGHYPWFTTFNLLNEAIPKPEGTLAQFARNGGIGFTASVVSDTVSNSFRVVKTTRQTYDRPISYPEVVRSIVKEHGVISLFGRGLKTRIMSNGLQGLMFSVLWKYFQQIWEKN